MNDQLSAQLAYEPQSFSTRCRRLRVKTWLTSLLALGFALFAAPLLADDTAGVVSHNATSVPQEEISWMSGGIGDEARDEMRRAAASYSVHLVFSEADGHYLASIPYSVSRANGREIYAGISEGPLLYLKLGPGSYRIAAKLDGAWQSKLVSVGGRGLPARVSFVAGSR